MLLLKLRISVLYGKGTTPIWVVFPCAVLALDCCYSPSCIHWMHHSPSKRISSQEYETKLLWLWKMYQMKDEFSIWWRKNVCILICQFFSNINLIYRKVYHGRCFWAIKNRPYFHCVGFVYQVPQIRRRGQRRNINRKWASQPLSAISPSLLLSWEVVTLFNCVHYMPCKVV